jgi:hypothetical protein
MNVKVAALEQEIERLSDGAELENVSHLLDLCDWHRLQLILPTSLYNQRL